MQREQFSNQQTAYDLFAGMNVSSTNLSFTPDSGTSYSSTQSVFYIESSTQEFHIQSQQTNNSSLWLLGEHIKSLLSTDKSLPVYFGVPIDLLRLILLLILFLFIIQMLVRWVLRKIRRWQKINRLQHRRRRLLQVTASVIGESEYVVTTSCVLDSQLQRGISTSPTHNSTTLSSPGVTFVE